MKVKFYKIRAIVFLYINKFLTFVLRVEMPPMLSVSAIISKDSEILFLDLSYSKGYALPGGHVQGGESLGEAISREVLEETGLFVKESILLGSYPSKYMGIPTICVSFIVKISGEIKSSEEGELLWIDPTDSKIPYSYQDNKMAVKDFLKIK